MAADTDLELDQGATWRVSLTYEDEFGSPISLVGYSARMQARKTIKATTPVLDLSSASGGGLTLSAGGTGVIDIYAGASMTASIDRDLHYDLHLTSTTDANEVIRVFGGKILVTKAVTR